MASEKTATLTKLDQAVISCAKRVFALQLHVKMPTESTIERVALGRPANIGDFYDAGRDIFIHGNLFNQSVPPECLTMLKAPFCTTHFYHTTTTVEKMEIWNLDGELSLSLLSGLVKIASGSATYLNEKSTSSKSVHCVFAQKVQTEVESVNLASRGLGGILASSGIPKEATHVVVGIKKGCNAFVELTYKAEDNNSQNVVNGGIEMNLKKVWRYMEKKMESEEDARSLAKFSGNEDNGNGNMKKSTGPTIGGKESSKETEEKTEISLKIYADLCLNQGNTPLTIEEGLQTVKRIADEVSKGVSSVPISYVLLDVNEVSRILNIPLQAQSIFNSLDATQLQKAKDMLAEIEEQLLKITELAQKMAQFKETLPDERFQSVTGKLKECKMEVKRTQEKIADVVSKIRRSEQDFSLLMEFCQIFTDFSISPVNDKNMKQFFSENGDLISFAKFFDQLKSKEVVLIENSEDFLELKRKKAAAYVLFYTLDCFSHFDETWEKTRSEFFNLCDEKKSCYVANAHLLSELVKGQNLGEGPRIVIMENNAYLTEDFVGDIQKLEQHNVVFPTEKHLETVIGTLDLVSAKLPCPNHFCQSKQDLQWYCSECHKLLEYDLRDHFYCGCGRLPLDKLTFKCASEKHGSTVFAYPQKKLRAELNNLKPYERINILVIGETGVGKTTWINSLPSYLTFESLEEAQKEPLRYLIPFQFNRSIPGDNGVEMTTIKFGSSKNEVHVIGKSATQRPHSYYFKTNDTVYCVIDTPGVGDCDGLDQDKKNMQNIIDYVCQLETIHLICFLMPPDQPRLHDRFEFCFKELIMQFHRSAIDNIAFCITKACGVNFQVGDTSQCLKELVERIREKRKISIPLNKSNMFIFDNIGFLHLAAVEKKMQMDEQQTSLAQRSFEVSRKATLRMMQQASSCRPHLTDETKQINLARKVIQRLTGPLTMIATKVRETIAEMDDRAEKVEKYKGDEEQLLKILSKKVVIHRSRLSVGRHVICDYCFNQIDSENNLLSLDFSRMLGLFCGTGIAALAVTAACAVPVAGIFFGMAAGSVVKTTMFLDEEEPCVVCNSSVDKYVCLVQMVQIEDEKEEIDKGVQRDIKTTEENRVKIERLLEADKQLMAELEEEKQAITKALIRFGSFLKENSIVPYNDIAEEYLHKAMDVEIQKSGRNTRLFKIYEEMLNKYKEEKNTLENLPIESCDQKEITAKHVLGLTEELKTLKHYGKDVKEALDFVTSEQYERSIQEGRNVYDPKGELSIMARLGTYVKRIGNRM